MKPLNWITNTFHFWYINSRQKVFPRELSHPGAQYSEIKFVNIWSRKAPGVFELSASFGSCNLFVLLEILWKTQFITLALTINMISTLIKLFFRYKCIYTQSQVKIRANLGSRWSWYRNKNIITIVISWYPLLDIWSRKYREGLIAREPSQAGWLAGRGWYVRIMWTRDNRPLIATRMLILVFFIILRTPMSLNMITGATWFSWNSN